MNNNRKILVIDDSQTMYKIIAKNLEANGIIDADYAPDGLSGVKIARIKDYDLITMDIDMPGIDGFEAAKEILKENSGQKILFISARFNEDNIIKAKEIGINYFLPKPFSFELFTTTIFEALGS
ncbi:MAG: response regulator [bacterium]